MTGTAGTAAGTGRSADGWSAGLVTAILALSASSGFGALELRLRAVGQLEQPERAQVAVDQGTTSASVTPRPSARPTSSAISA